MSHPIFDDPENKVVLGICRSSPGFIPIIVNGQLHPVRELNIAAYPVSPFLSAEDFVLGLEVLGCTIGRNENDDVVVREPRHFRSPLWGTRARQIQAMMSDFWEGRRTELSDYLHSRDEAAEVSK